MSRTDTLSPVRNTAFVSVDNCSVFEVSMEMLAYKKMYNIMFNAATDAIGRTQDAQAILCKAQQNCEEILMAVADTESPVFMDRTEKE